MRRCENCNGTEFVSMGNNVYECVCCGHILYETSENEENVDAASLNKVDSLEEILKDALEMPQLDVELVKDTSDELIQLEPKNIVATFFRTYLNKNSYPENYKKWFDDFANVEVDSVLEKDLIDFAIAHSDYKFFDQINKCLVARGLYEQYSNDVFNAINKIQVEEENYSSVPRDVFICYSSNDLEVVKNISESLENNGISTWYSDRNMPKNSLNVSDYKAKIEDSISKAKTFLVITSKNSMLSKDVKWELELAEKYGITNRVEYRIEDVEHTATFKNFFDGYQWIDASTDTQVILLTGRISNLLNPTPVNTNKTVLTKSLFIDDPDEDDNFDEEEVSFDPFRELNGEHSILLNSETDGEEVEDHKSKLEDQEESSNFNVLTKSILLPFDEDEDYQDKLSYIINLFETGNTAAAIEEVEKFDEFPEETNCLIYYYIFKAFFNGESVEQNNDAAKFYWNKVIEKEPCGSNEDIAECFYFMGKECFINQLNVERKGLQESSLYEELFKNKAYKYFKTSAECGNIDAVAYVGLCYQYGFGVEQNDNKAMEYFNKGANLGSSEAFLALGRAYEKGYVVPKDDNKAFFNFKRAADFGNVHAMVNVGVCYYYGKGCTQDKMEAVVYYKAAADENNATAQYNLARCYLNGECVTKDEAEGARLMKLAADNGNKAARKFLRISN